MVTLLSIAVVVLLVICGRLYFKRLAWVRTVGAMYRAQCMLGVALKHLPDENALPDNLRVQIGALRKVAAACEHYSWAWYKRDHLKLARVARLQEVRALQMHYLCTGRTVDRPEAEAALLEELVSGA